jgi:hypothetical protein
VLQAGQVEAERLAVIAEGGAEDGLVDIAGVDIGLVEPIVPVPIASSRWMGLAAAMVP